jgi:hypothetical protein
MKEMELAARVKNEAESKEAFDKAFERLAPASRSFDPRGSKLQNPISVLWVPEILSRFVFSGKVSSGLR